MIQGQLLPLLTFSPEEDRILKDEWMRAALNWVRAVAIDVAAA